MKRRSFVAALLAIVVTAAGCGNHRPLGFEDGWIALFDGTEASLKNWEIAGDANWRYFRGAVEADSRKSKTSSFLVSRNSYRDFQLQVEFWASHDSNSGIYMRCADRKKITDRSCYEANIFDQRADPLYGTGAIVHLAPVHPMPKAGGKWNTFDITVKGNRISVWLNGEPTVDLVDSKLSAGPIALQYAGGVIKFRKVRVRPL